MYNMSLFATMQVKNFPGLRNTGNSAKRSEHYALWTITRLSGFTDLISRRTFTTLGRHYGAHPCYLRGSADPYRHV